VCADVSLPKNFNYFIPSSLLSELRRQAVEKRARWSEMKSERRDRSEELVPLPVKYVPSYLYNISNKESRSFYEQLGVKNAAPALELQEPENAVLMQCRHCLRYSLGCCVKHGGQRPAWREPLYLQLGDGRRFRLEFDCKNCQMNVYASS
jgi:putative protease